jgi:hypothetical protein
MSVNTTEVSSVYTTLYAAVKTNIDDLYTVGRIDSETYARMLAESIGRLVEVSIQAVQTQEKLDEEIKLTYVQRVVADKQAAGLGLDEVMLSANITPEDVYKPKYKDE